MHAIAYVTNAYGHAYGYAYGYWYWYGYAYGHALSTLFVYVCMHLRAWMRPFNAITCDALRCAARQRRAQSRTYASAYDSRRCMRMCHVCARGVYTRTGECMRMCSMLCAVCFVPCACALCASALCAGMRMCVHVCACVCMSAVMLCAHACRPLRPRDYGNMSACVWCVCGFSCAW